MGAVSLDRVQRAQDLLIKAVAGNPDVNGVGISRADGGYVLKVNVRRDAARHSVPAEIHGVPVRVQTVGRVRKRHVI